MHPEICRSGFLIALVLLAGCDDTIFGVGSGGTDTSSSQGGWCAVTAIFDRSCTSCHSPGAGPLGDLDLETDPYTALVGVASPEYAGQTLVVAGDPAASFLLTKLKGTQSSSEGSQMPLGAPLSQAQLDTISAWIADGATTDCTGGGDTVVPDCNTDNESCTERTCEGEGGSMLPGSNCLTCHDGTGEAPKWTAAGTAFTDLYGTAPLSGATVRIVDSYGTTHTLTTNSVGNFYTSASIPTPFSASIETDGGTLTMSASQTTGACSSCHVCEGTPGGKLYGL